MEPGIYTDVPFDQYNALPYLRNSYLKKLGSSCPAAAQLPDDGDSPALALGRATHALTLEGIAAFNKDFIVTPADAPGRPTDAMRNAKKPSPESIHRVNWWNQFEQMSAGKQVISFEDYATIQAMDASVKAHPFARTLLSDGLSEQTAIFDAQVGGETIRCKVRPDRTPSSKTACLIDLKSCADASYRGFLNACYRFGYFHQAAMYIDGYNEAQKVMIEQHGWSPEEHPDIDAFVFIAIEKTAPYRCEVYTLMGDNSLLIQGREEFQMNLMTELQCRRQGFYPNYQEAGAQELLPYSERV